MINLIRAFGDRVSLYLPVILMGVLASGTYWLVRSTPLLISPGQDAPVRHEPDYFMRKFSVKSFDGAGRLKTELLGVDARHFPDTDTMEIDLVRISALGEDGGLTTATAKQAVTNADASELALFGDARVVRESVADKAGQLQPRLEFRGEYLHVFLDTERVKSHKPVELTRGNDRFIADTMDFDNLERIAVLKGHVKVALVPPPPNK